MYRITFLSKNINKKIIKCELEENLEDVCRRYAEEINKDLDKICFYSNSEKLYKSMKVTEFNNSYPKKNICRIKKGYCF